MINKCGHCKMWKTAKPTVHEKWKECSVRKQVCNAKVRACYWFKEAKKLKLREEVKPKLKLRSK